MSSVPTISFREEAKRTRIIQCGKLLTSTSSDSSSTPNEQQTSANAKGSAGDSSRIVKRSSLVRSKWASSMSTVLPSTLQRRQTTPEMIHYLLSRFPSYRAAGGAETNNPSSDDKNLFYRRKSKPSSGSTDEISARTTLRTRRECTLYNQTLCV